MDYRFPPQIQHIGAELYKINRADPFNILNINSNSLMPGSLDWNNRVKPEQVLRLVNQTVPFVTAETAVFNSGYGALREVDGSRSTSILIGSPTLLLRTVSNIRMMSSLGSRWAEINPVVEQLQDFFYTKGGIVANYQTTGFQFVDPNKDGLIYPEPGVGGIMIPSPVNGKFSPNLAGLSMVNWDTYHNVGMLMELGLLDSYVLTSQITSNRNLFNISGTTYGYDGQKIWILNFTGFIPSGWDYVTDADSMVFLGNNTAQAFFLASDKYVWSFTGSFTLSLIYDLTNIHFDFISAIYSQNLDELVLQFKDKLIAIRKGVIRYVDLDADYLQTCKYGVVYSTADSNTILINESSDDVVPFYLDTGWIGMAEDSILSFTKIWFRFKDDVNCKVLVDTLNDFRITPQWITVNKTDTYITPKQVTGRALRIKIKSDAPIRLADITVEHEPRGNVAAITRRSK